MSMWVKPYLKKFRVRILLSILFGFLGVASGAMLLFVSGYLISKSALRPENIMIVYVPIVSVRAFSIGRAVFLYVEKLISHDITLRILEKMRSKLYRIIEPQALFLRSRFQTGDLLGVLADDIEHLQDLYLRTLFPSIVGLMLYVIMAITFGVFDLAFAVLVLLMFGILVFLVPFLSFVKMKKKYPTIKKVRHHMYGQLTDALFGITDWLASGRVHEWTATFMDHDNKLLKTERNMQRFRQLRDACLQVVIGIIIILLIIWTSVQTSTENIQPTLIAAFVLMIFTVTEALMPISDAVEHIPSYNESINRLNNLQAPYEITLNSQQTTQLDNKMVDIAIKNVHFKYPSSHKDVLNNITLHIPAGRKVAVLGKSGTGKSTLLKLLAGALRPTSGSILVNGEEMNSHYLSSVVSVLNQKPHLFSTTILNNIRLGKENATDEEIQDVIERAQLSHLIESLPDGVNTQMREMGQRFSGGERQRIAFARVLLQDTPIILIDEATIGLDPLTERSLIQMMLEATKEKTVIWITHHLAGVEWMDDVLFLRDGQIAMHGSHEELLKENEHYQKLYQMDKGL